jgi:hypothetical protein
MNNSLALIVGLALAFWLIWAAAKTSLLLLLVVVAPVVAAGVMARRRRETFESARNP